MQSFDDRTDGSDSPMDVFEDSTGENGDAVDESGPGVTDPPGEEDGD
jgi:hypothetical protein